MNSKPVPILSGSIAIDRIMSFSGRYQDTIHPDKLDVLSVSVLVDTLTHSHGGTAANIAYNLALLNDHPILLGSIGSDAFPYLEKLSGMGVNTENVFNSSLPTASFTVLTDRDNNQVGGFFPGAMTESINCHLSRWQHSLGLVVVSANDPATMRQHVQEAQTYGLPLAYDVGQQVSNLSPADLVEGIKAAKLLFVSEYELNVITSRTSLSLDTIKKTVPLVITTFGSQGSSIEGTQIDTPITIPAVSKCTVVDPTGAGDAYRGGFLYGYVRQWDLETCAQLGTILASFCIEASGTQLHVPTFEDIKKRFTNTFSKELHL